MLQDFEKTHSPLSQAQADAVSAKQAQEYVSVLVGFGRAFGFMEETIHDAVQLFDRVRDKGTAQSGSLSVQAAVILLIAARQGTMPAVDRCQCMLRQACQCVPIAHHACA